MGKYYCESKSQVNLKQQRYDALLWQENIGLTIVSPNIYIYIICHNSCQMYY